MKKLDLVQMENLRGADCPLMAAGIIVGFAGAAIAVATGGVGTILLAGASYYLTLDGIGRGGCY
ncbi:hypothetical protein [Daejeonia sp. YH14]|uniref:hypothetical protein n=1 Tax=Daejeonia sp. YH14 TaxID=3439042 RepID=UPI003F494105